MISDPFPTVRIPGSGAATAPPFAFHQKRPWVALADCAKKQVTIFDCISGVLQHALLVHEDPVEILFDRAGDHLVAFGAKEMCTWVLSEPPKASYRLLTNSDPYDDLFVPTLLDGEHGVWALTPNSWQLYSIADGRLVKSLTIANAERLLRLTRTASGHAVAVTYDEERANHSSFVLSVWNLDNGELLYESGHSEWHGILVSYDARFAIIEAKGTGGLASVWNIEKGKHLHDVDGLWPTGHREFCADNRHVLTNGANATWRAWLTLTDVLARDRKLIDPNTPYPPAFACSPVDNIFATVVNDLRHPVDMTGFWSVKTGDQLGWATGHVGLARHRFSACGRWYATASNSLGAETTVNALPGGSLVISDIRSITQKA